MTPSKLTPIFMIIQREQHGGKNTRLYRIWSSMKARCFNPRRKDYSRYGAKGVTVCDEWKASFVAFRDWALANGYSDNLTLDRAKSHVGYCPDNCRWVSSQQQEWNKGKSIAPNASSRFRGVSRGKGYRKWVAMIWSGDSNRRIGLFDSELEAALAYDDAAYELRGEFAHLNFPERKLSLRKEVSHLSA